MTSFTSKAADAVPSAGSASVPSPAAARAAALMLAPLSASGVTVVATVHVWLTTRSVSSLVRVTSGREYLCRGAGRGAEAVAAAAVLEGVPVGAGACAPAGRQAEREVR